MSLPDPRFPPAYAPRAVAADIDVVRAAIDGARQGELVAGDLIWSRQTTRAQAAIVLEPELPLSQAVLAVPLLMVSIADALGAIGPPNLAITLRWPRTVLANGGEVGRVGLWIPEDIGADVIAPRLVIDVDLAMEREEALQDPGVDPTVTVLGEEGCGDLDRTQILEAVSRHFLARLDEWQEDGFAPARRAFLVCADGLEGDVEVDLGLRRLRGRMKGLALSGGFLMESDGATMEIPLGGVLRTGRQSSAPLS